MMLKARLVKQNNLHQAHKQSLLHFYFQSLICMIHSLCYLIHMTTRCVQVFSTVFTLHYLPYSHGHSTMFTLHYFTLFTQCIQVFSIMFTLHYFTLFTRTHTVNRYFVQCSPYIILPYSHGHTLNIGIFYNVHPTLFYVCNAP